MMNYKKGKNVEEELTRNNIPIDCLPENFLWMHVKGSTKVSNVVDYAKNALDNGEYRSIVWTGSGGGIGKTISCAEIIKRNYDLHQVTRICYQKIEEYWDPITKGLEQIVASRQIPCIHILTSLDEIDTATLGYQHSKKKTLFWNDPSRKKQNNLPNYHDQIKAKHRRDGGGGNKQHFKNKNKGNSSKQEEQNKNFPKGRNKSENKNERNNETKDMIES